MKYHNECYVCGHKWDSKIDCEDCPVCGETYYIGVDLIEEIDVSEYNQG